MHRSPPPLALLVASTALVSLGWIPAAPVAPSFAPMSQEAADPPPQEAAAPPPLPLTPQVIRSPEATELYEAALSGAVRQDFDLTFRPYFFPFSGGTLTMVGFAMGRNELMFGVDPFAAAAEGAQLGAAAPEVARLELFGSLRRDGVDVHPLGTGFSVRSGSGNGEMTGVHSFGETLAPGRYEVVWGVRDTVSGRATTRVDALEVPDFTASGLTTSTVMLVASNPTPVAGQFQPNTVYEGVRVFTAAFPDDIDRTFAAGTAEVMLVFVVFGMQTDAASNAPSLELSYRILDGEGVSLWRAAPQTLNRQTVGQQIPLAQIEPLQAGGEFHFEISVRDLLAGTVSTTEIPFTIAGS